MKYAISAIPGHEAETAGADLADGRERIDAELGLRYEIAAYIEAETAEEAFEAALRYYGIKGIAE